MDERLPLDDLSLTTLDADDGDLAVVAHMVEVLYFSIRHAPSAGATRQTGEAPDMRVSIVRCTAPGGGEHRLRVQDAEGLRDATSMPLVAFIGKRRLTLPPALGDHLALVDQRLVAELAMEPDLLSYSSMELPDGNWANLVVFRRVRGTAALRNSCTHRHASTHLAPQVFHWIRLHHGLLTRDTSGWRVLLQRTRYYAYADSEVDRPLSIREVRRLAAQQGNDVLPATVLACPSAAARANSPQW